MGTDVFCPKGILEGLSRNWIVDMTADNSRNSADSDSRLCSASIRLLARPCNSGRRWRVSCWILELIWALIARKFTDDVWESRFGLEKSSQSPLRLKVLPSHCYCSPLAPNDLVPQVLHRTLTLTVSHCHHGELYLWSHKNLRLNDQGLLDHHQELE